MTEDATLTITLLTLILLPFASALLAALLALRDGGLVAWEWVRILLIASLFLALQIVLPGHAPWAVSIAMVMVLAFQVAGFYAWRIFGTGVPSDGT